MMYGFKSHQGYKSRGIAQWQSSWLLTNWLQVRFLLPSILEQIEYQIIMKIQSPRQVHPYHQVDLSPWPFFMSFTVFSMGIGIVSWQGHYPSNPQSYIPVQIQIAIQWFRDIIREAKGGYHTTTVQRGLLIGFLQFIISEIMQFVSFFWAFFHSSLSPNIELGAIWPAPGIIFIDTWSLPLIGTCIQLASGFVLTWGHHSLVEGDKISAIQGLFLSIIQGFMFVYMQYNEYYYAPFTFADSVLGGVFYLTTGGHFLHIQVGLIFLIVGQIRVYMDHYTSEHHLGLEFSIYYWHFVDVVWLFVFSLIYWWGGSI